MMKNLIFDFENGGSTYAQVNMVNDQQSEIFLKIWQIKGSYTI